MAHSEAGEKYIKWHKATVTAVRGGKVLADLLVRTKDDGAAFALENLQKDLLISIAEEEPRLIAEILTGEAVLLLTELTEEEYEVESARIDALQNAGYWRLECHLGPDCLPIGIAMVHANGVSQEAAEKDFAERMSGESAVARICLRDGMAHVKSEWVHPDEFEASAKDAKLAMERAKAESLENFKHLLEVGTTPEATTLH
jgi:hypothetical protein